MIRIAAWKVLIWNTAKKKKNSALCSGSDIPNFSGAYCFSPYTFYFIDAYSQTLPICNRLFSPFLGQLDAIFHRSSFSVSFQYSNDNSCIFRYQTLLVKNT